MYYVYVIKSLKDGKRYVGFSKKQPKERLAEHNVGSNIQSKNHKPFVLIYSESFVDENIARKRERFFKTGKGRNILNNIIPGQLNGGASRC